MKVYFGYFLNYYSLDFYLVHYMLLKNLHSNANKANSFIKSFTESYYKGINLSDDDTSTILDTSIVTKREYWKKTKGAWSE